MDTKNPSRRRSSASSRRGATTFHIVVLLVPVLFSLMGFAVDIGRLYMIRAELKTAANSAALAAAQRLAGYDFALDGAGQAANAALAEAGGFANKIDYGGRVIGAEGILTSTIEEPQYFETVADAVGTGDGAGGGGTGVAKHVRITLSAEAPTVFFRFLPIGQEGRVPIRVLAAAGVGAPMCTVCGIEPIVIAAPDATDEENFGFTVGTRYTLGYSCNGQPQPQPVAGAQRLPYLLLDRYDQDIDVTENLQAFRMGSSGIPGNVLATKWCFDTATTQTVWASAAAPACNQNNVPTPTRAFTCGLASRFEAGVYTGCETVDQDVETYSQALVPDTDPTDTDDYQSTYAGNARRVITIAIAESLADTTTIQLVGFRQFLLNPVANTTNINAVDTNARFLVTYIGSPMPLKNGRTSGCATPLTYGPGKVVLHQ